MTVESTLSSRVEQALADFRREQDQDRYDAFDLMKDMVDTGEMDWDDLLAIQRELGAVALVREDMQP